MPVGDKAICRKRENSCSDQLHSLPSTLLDLKHSLWHMSCASQKQSAMCELISYAESKQYTRAMDHNNGYLSAFDHYISIMYLLHSFVRFARVKRSFFNRTGLNSLSYPYVFTPFHDLFYQENPSLF